MVNTVCPVCGPMLIMDVTSILSPITTKLKKFTKEQNRDFSAFRFSLQLILNNYFKSLSDDFTQKYIQKLHKRARML